MPKKRITKANERNAVDILASVVQIQIELNAKMAQIKKDMEALKALPCHEYKPDHNGECLNCDEWYEAHLPPHTKVKNV